MTLSIIDNIKKYSVEGWSWGTFRFFTSFFLLVFIIERRWLSRLATWRHRSLIYFIWRIVQPGFYFLEKFKTDIFKIKGTKKKKKIKSTSVVLVLSHSCNRREKPGLMPSNLYAQSEIITKVYEEEVHGIQTSTALPTWVNLDHEWFNAHCSLLQGKFLIELSGKWAWAPPISRLAMFPCVYMALNNRFTPQWIYYYRLQSRLLSSTI